MKTRLLITILCVVLLVMMTTTWANPYREKKVSAQEFSADVTPEGYYVDPIYANWGLDQVVWTQQTNALLPFLRAASGHLGDYVYCFGEQSTNIAQAFNLITNTWESSTPPLYGDCNWCGVATDNAIYIVGRYDGSYYNDIQKFTPTAGGPTGTWELMAPYPQSLCAVTADWDGDNYIYAAGGSSSSPAAYRYDIAANVWTSIADMPSMMRYAGGAFVNGKFYVMGGTQSGMANTLYEYDPASNTWATRAPVPIPVYFGLFSTTYNRGYLISVGGGGGYGSWPATNAVQLYDPSTDTWTQESTLPVAYGCNTGCWVGSPSDCISAGGYDGSLPYHIETYRGTGFPGDVSPDAPASPSNFTVEDNGATIMASLSWTNPTTTVSGGTLTSIDTVFVDRDGVIINTITTATPGQTIAWDDNTMSQAGYYSYSVWCSNTAGHGAHANASAWIGPDVPYSVSDLLMTPGTNYQLEATLTWINPQSGVHGGFYPGVTGYIIIRDSDEGHTATFDLPGTHTTFVDQTIPDPDNYWYEVTPYNASGEGLAATSNTAWVGYSETWTWEEVAYVWNDISSIGTNAGLTSDDQNVGPFPLGFEFEFFGEDVFTSIRLCSNGWQSFTSTVTTLTNATIPTTLEPNNLIASFWDDLSFYSSGTAYYYYDAVAGTFSVQYSNVGYYSGGGDVTFQIVLDDEDNTITCYYNSITGINTSCTVGIENAAGDEGVQACFNGMGNFIPTNNTAIRFSPPEPPQFGALQGFVYEEATPNDPIEGALVVVRSDTGYTDATGSYRIENIYVGTTIASAHAFGYNSMTESVVIALDSTTSMDYYLTQPLVDVSISSIDLVLPANSPHEEEFYIWNVGNGPLDFDIMITGIGTDWLSLTPVQGTVAAGDSETVTISFLMPDTATAGDHYEADIEIDNNSIDPHVVIPVDVSIIPNAVVDDDAVLPTQFALHQNYPNPFNPTTTITYDVPVQGLVQLEMFDVLGRKVATLIDGEVNAGRYNVTWNASGMPSGIYFCQMQTASFHQVRKIVLLK